MGVITDRHVLHRLIKKIEQQDNKGDINAVSPLTNIVNNQGGSNTLPPLENLVDSPTLPQTVKAKTKKGRPSGTTNAEKVRLIKAKKDCIDTITRMYMEARKRISQEENGVSLPKAFLLDLIAAQKEVFRLPPEHNIPLATIYSRMRPGRSRQPPHRGTVSTMATAERVAVAKKARRKELRVQQERMTAVMKLFVNNPIMASWTNKECGTFLQYKKRDDDPKMPSKIADRRKRCLEIAHRTSPCCSPHASDDEDEEDIVAGISRNEIIIDTRPPYPIYLEEKE